LFESAADAYGAALIGVILSGANEDGAAGLLCIKKRGGLTIVQDLKDAEITYMPKAAMETANPDHVLTAEGIRNFLVELAK
jgi:two-component system chemotaxis response regulator CheB